MLSNWKSASQHTRQQSGLRARFGPPLPRLSATQTTSYRKPGCLCYCMSLRSRPTFVDSSSPVQHPAWLARVDSSSRITSDSSVTVRHVVLPASRPCYEYAFHQHDVVPCGNAAPDEYLEAIKAGIDTIVEEKAWMMENEGWKQTELEDMACAIDELAVALVLRHRLRTLGGHGEPHPRLVARRKLQRGFDRNRGRVEGQHIDLHCKCPHAPLFQ